MWLPYIQALKMFNKDQNFSLKIASWAFVLLVLLFINSKEHFSYTPPSPIKSISSRFENRNDYQGLLKLQKAFVRNAKSLKPSPRGEIEITDLNRLYLNEGKLKVEILDRGYAWLDTGSHENLLQASKFVHTIIERQGLQIGCLEEIAFEQGFIDENTLKSTISLA